MKHIKLRWVTEGPNGYRYLYKDKEGKAFLSEDKDLKGYETRFTVNEARDCNHFGGIPQLLYAKPETAEEMIYVRRRIRFKL